MTGQPSLLENAFFAFAKERTGLPPKLLRDYLARASDYCHLRQPLLGMTDVAAVYQVHEKVKKGMFFRIRFGVDAEAIRQATFLYLQFITSYSETPEVPVREAVSRAIEPVAEKSAEETPPAEPIPQPEEPAAEESVEEAPPAEPILQPEESAAEELPAEAEPQPEEPTLEEQPTEAMPQPEEPTLEEQPAEAMPQPEEPAPEEQPAEPTSQPEESAAEEQPAEAMPQPEESATEAPPTEATPQPEEVATEAPPAQPIEPLLAWNTDGLLLVDFSREQSYAFTQPDSFVYKGIVCHSNAWKNLYTELCGLLFADYASQFKTIINGDVPGYNSLAFADEKQEYRMRVPRSFAKGYYVETNLDATSIVRRIRGLHKLFNLGDDLRIAYRKTRNRDDAEPVRPVQPVAKPGRPNKSAQPEKPQEDWLLAQLKSLRIPYQDNRAEGGCLWIRGNMDIPLSLSVCRNHQYNLHYKPDGYKAWPNEPAWWTTDRPQDGAADEVASTATTAASVAPKAVAPQAATVPEKAPAPAPTAAATTTDERQDSFKTFLMDKKQLTEPTANGHVRALADVEAYIRDNQLPFSIINATADNVSDVINALMARPDFVKKDYNQYGKYKAAMRHYTAYLKKGDVPPIKPPAAPRIRNTLTIIEAVFAVLRKTGAPQSVTDIHNGILAEDLYFFNTTRSRDMVLRAIHDFCERTQEYIAQGRNVLIATDDNGVRKYQIMTAEQAAQYLEQQKQAAQPAPITGRGYVVRASFGRFYGRTPSEALTAFVNGIGRHTGRRPAENMFPKGEIGLRAAKMYAHYLCKKFDLDEVPDMEETDAMPMRHAAISDEPRREQEPQKPIPAPVEEPEELTSVPVAEPEQPASVPVEEPEQPASAPVEEPEQPAPAQEREQEPPQSAAVAPRTEADSSSSRWETVLRESFAEGYIPQDYLSQLQASAYWEERFGEACPLTGEAIDQAIRAVGSLRGGRIYPRSEEDRQLIAAICAEIDRLLTSCTSVYRSCIYERYREQLAACAIYTEQVMSDLLLEAAHGSFICSYGIYMRRVGEGSVTADCRSVLRARGGAMQVDEVAAILWFIPRDVVYHTLATDDEALNLGTGTWMLAEHFPLTREDAERIGDMLTDYFQMGGYVPASGLPALIAQRLPGIAENLGGLPYQAVFNIVQYYLRGRFSFTRAMISPRGMVVDYKRLFQGFAADHESFTLEELEAFSSELKMAIYWESIYAGGAVRVSREQFVRRDGLRFDVSAVDAVLAELCPGDYLPLQAVTPGMMMHLPGCGYAWNGYLLLCYVLGYSEAFRLSYNSLSKTGVYGAMVRRSCTAIDDYAALVTRVLTDEDGWNTRQEALALLVQMGLQANRTYSGIDDAMRQARRNKLMQQEGE